MQWANALSTRPSLEAAVTEVVEKVTQSLSGAPDLGIVFISSAYGSDYPRLVPLILEKLPLPVLIGCGGGGVIGMKTPNLVWEVEANPALSLTVANLPGVDIEPFQINSEQLPDLDSPPNAWSDLIRVSPTKNPQFILLCDPFTSRINDLLEGLDFAYPEAVKIGGLASASTMGLPSALFYHHPKTATSQLYREGIIGLAVSGNIIVETIVAQGCRPIGQPWRISQGERNIILELTDPQDNSFTCTPLEKLRDLIPTLSDKDQQLAQTSLFIGIARDEFTSQLQPGDFLIRNLLGVDPRQGAIAIGDHVRPGQRIQFHLRDADTSAMDLELLLQSYQQTANPSSSALGALMFSCLGRGEALYGKPNFDSRLFRRYLDSVPLGGFFCNGEIGPVGGSTFLHGYTSAFAIFRTKLY
jgi:small ligand-binding sensory domain FIST